MDSSSLSDLVPLAPATTFFFSKVIPRSVQEGVSFFRHVAVMTFSRDVSAGGDSSSSVDFMTYRIFHIAAGSTPSADFVVTSFIPGVDLYFSASVENTVGAVSSLLLS